MWHSKAGDQISLLESQRERVTRFPTSRSPPDGAICIWARPQGGLQPGPYPVVHLSEKGRQGAPEQGRSRGWRRTRAFRWGLEGGVHGCWFGGPAYVLDLTVGFQPCPWHILPF